MTTVLDAPAEQQTAPGRGGRWVALAVVLLLALAAVGVEAVHRYQPLERGHSSIGTRVPSPPTYGENTPVELLPFEPGSRQRLAFTVRNTGRFAITVDALVRDEPGSFLRRLEGKAYGEDRRFVDFQHEVTLPHRLAPGHEMGFEVFYLEPDCGLYAGDRQTWQGINVRWHAFGGTHVTDVDQDIVAFEVPEDYTGPATKPCTGITYLPGDPSPYQP